MRWTADVGRGEWLRERMHGWARRDSVVPRGFEAVARIFHPATRTWWDGPVNAPGSTRFEQRPVRWTEVARLRGTAAHPWMQWGAIARQQSHEVDLDDGTSVDPAEEGRVPRAVLEALLPLLRRGTTTPDRVTAGVWEGWGELHHVVEFGPAADGRPVQRRVEAPELGVAPEIVLALEHGPLLDLPGRRYVLLEGALDDLADPAWTAAAGLGRDIGGDGVRAPQLLWPEDRAWCLAAEIDWDFSLLAGPRRLVDGVLASAGLEAAELDGDGDLSFDGDTVNPSPVDRR